jgi:predicted PurR-regulated permease PerM
VNFKYTNTAKSQLLTTNNHIENTQISPSMNRSKQASLLYYLQISIGVTLILYVGRTVLIPLSFGMLIAMVLYPFCRWMERKGLSRTASIGTSLFLLLVITLSLMGLLSWQLVAFQKEWPLISSKLDVSVKNLQDWVATYFNITLDMQTQWVRQLLMNAGNRLGSLVTGTLTVTAGLLFFLIIVPLFAALFLYHRRLFIRFLDALLGDSYHQPVARILSQTIQTYHNYIKGLLMVYAIVGVLNSLGLALLGIRQPILFGMIASVLTIIPYVGITMGSLLPMAVAWIMYDSMWYPLGVVAIFAFVQYLEANVIFPLVVGTQLKMNALAALVALLVGGVIWGVSGMVLFLPFAAILKIVSDYVEEWKPLNILLSPMTEPKTSKMTDWIKQLGKKGG